jgi:hypothetical protein
MRHDIVQDYLISLVTKQVADSRIVIWYDPDGLYTDVLAALNLPDTTVMRYEIDQRYLMDGQEPPLLVVYVPMAHDQ